MFFVTLFDQIIKRTYYVKQLKSVNNYNKIWKQPKKAYIFQYINYEN